MEKNISRRRALASGALSAGLLTGVSSEKANAEGLDNVWGNDFLRQWSPPPNLKKNLIPGNSHIRLAAGGYRLTNAEGTDYGAVVKSMRAAGFTACEASSSWVDRKMPDSEIRELKAILKENDVDFYGLHCRGNIIAAAPDDERWQRHIIDSVNAAEEFDCSHVLTHAGSFDEESRGTPNPHNWGRAAWIRSVNALKRIAKDTAGSPVDLAIEAVNTESINCPEAHARLRQDVGDPRITVGLDVTNMMYAGVAYRTTELINKCFDMLADQISYIHAKDIVWSSMLPGLEWTMNGTGLFDYETFLVRISRLKEPKPMYIEFLKTPEEYAEARRNVLNIAREVGVTIYGA